MCLNESLLKEIAAAIAEQNAPTILPSGATVDEQRSDAQDLPQREWVWALESDLPGRLCGVTCHITRTAWISVFRSEEDAWADTRSARWPGGNASGVVPIHVSLDTVVQQVREQGPAPDSYPLCGYAWLPDEDRVEVPL